MRLLRRLGMPLFLLGSLLDLGAAARAGSESGAIGQSDPLGARRYFTDVILVNQDGNEMRFYSDLIEGRTVLIDSFFTVCTGVCPVMNGKFTAIQEWLGDRLERDVRLISISVDPENDTPERLKEYARRFEARSGWYFLTGEPDDVALALTKLGQFVEDREEHSNLLILGNEATGRWEKIFGLAQPDDIVEALRRFLNEDDH